MLRKVCWHNWAGSPVQDTCGVDGHNCVMLNDDQRVVCWHTGFREPCNQQNKCRIDGKSCIVLTKPETVVCYHENYLDFGRPNNPNCNCTNIDGEHVRLLPNAPVAMPPAFAPGAHATTAMIKCSNRHNWTPCTGTCGCGSADGENIVYLTETEQVVCWNTNLKGRLDDPTMKVVGSIDGLNCFIMDKWQSIRWLNGKNITDYRQSIDNWFRAGWATEGESFKLDPFASVCKLMNRPFPKKMTRELWKQSAIVVMDVWDRHPDKGASSRLQNLAPAVDAFLRKARDQGALIIHSPSTMGNLYADRNRTDVAAMQARKNALDAAAGNDTVRKQFYYMGLVTGHMVAGQPSAGMFFDKIIYPAGDGPSIGPNMTTSNNIGSPRRQHPAIAIDSEDAVSAEDIDGCDAFREIMALTRGRPYLIYVGTATNWCILRRFNGMRSMYKAGKSLWLVRDLTDSVAGDDTNGEVQGLTDAAGYLTQDQGPDGKPMLPYTQEKRVMSHFRGTDLIVDWIGWNMPGTRTDTRDTEFSELGRYRFPDDKVSA